MQSENWKTWVFRQIMNIYPMFFATGGRATFIRSDWQHATVTLKLRLLTRNYVGTIFGGSQYAAIDPFHVVLLINRLGKEFIVWDKSASIVFKKPGKRRMKAEIIFTDEEIQNIMGQARTNGRYIFDKSVDWVDDHGEVVSTVTKTLYVATKEYYKNRKKS